MAAMNGTGAAGMTGNTTATWMLCRAFATLARAEPNMNGGILL